MHGGEPGDKATPYPNRTVFPFLPPTLYMYMHLCDGWGIKHFLIHNIIFSADAPDRKRTACYDIEVHVVRQGIAHVILVLYTESIFVSCFHRTVH